MVNKIVYLLCLYDDIQLGVVSVKKKNLLKQLIDSSNDDVVYNYLV